MNRVNNHIYVAKPSPLSNGDRVKVGNKRIDAATIERLRVEHAQKMRVNSITTSSKISKIESKIEEMDDPFTRRPTRPTRMGVRKPAATPAQKGNEEINNEIQSTATLPITSKRTSDSLDEQPQQKKIKLTIVTESAADVKTKKRTSKVLTSKH